jgi:hypothetical protein
MELADDDEDVPEDPKGMELLGSSFEDEEVEAADEEGDEEDEEDEEMDEVEDIEEKKADANEVDKKKDEEENPQEEEEGREDEQEQRQEDDAVTVQDSKQEMMSPPLSKRKRPDRVRVDRSEETEDEQEERKRKCRQRRSALSSPKSVDEVISKWIEEKGSGWNAQLRTDLEGRLLTYGISLTIDVVEGMVKQRLSEISK